MPAPTTNDDLLALVRKSGLVDPARLAAALDLPMAQDPPESPKQLAALLVRRGCITLFQAEQFLLGKWRGFTIGKYKVLERLGSGGCGTVYLCEHVLVQRKVAVKVLPSSRSDNPAALGRFYREARAAGRLNHPNLVKCHDVDEENGLHFLVLDYVDGVSLHDLISRFGPLSVPRAAQYIRQAALGLQAAHEAGLVHRDVKPANIVLDRAGVVRVLDLGLARFFADDDDPLTLKYDENNVLGTADYVAPEQALSSHDVDIRADVYSLGATFYFLLVGHPPFPGGKAAQKLIWHQVKQPTPVRRLRPEIPPELATVLERMMAKDRGQRQQSPGEVAEELSPWAETKVAPPSEREMPKLSRAARAIGGDAGPSALNRLGLPDSGRRARGAPTAEMPERGPDGRMSHHELPSPRRPSHSELATPSALAAPTLQEDGTKGAAASAPPSDARSSRTVAKQDPLTPNVRAIRLAILLILSGLVGAMLRSAMPQARPLAAPTPALWTVSRSGSPNTLPSIAAALKLAHPGDLIRVVDETWEELLDWRGEGGAADGVTLEGAAPGGGAVVWRSPAAAQREKTLIALHNTAGLHLRNFVLDGCDRLDELTALSGSCPGLVLEDVRLIGFRARGVALRDCRGDSNRPVELRRLRFALAAPTDAALAFVADSRQSNRSLLVADCRFEGPFRAAVVFEGPAQDVRLEGNRFFRSTDGVVYRKTSPPSPLTLTLTGNAFCSIENAALRVETSPPAGNVVVVENNLFAHCGRLAERDDPLTPDDSAIWKSSGNVRDSLSVEGNLELGARAAPLDLPTDPQDDARFLRRQPAAGAAPATDRRAMADQPSRP